MKLLPCPGCGATALAADIETVRYAARSMTLPLTCDECGEVCEITCDTAELDRRGPVYTMLDELNLDPDDLGFGGFTFKDNFEFEGIDQETMSLRLFSNWTDRLSTEFRYSNFDVIHDQHFFFLGAI